MTNGKLKQGTLSFASKRTGSSASASKVGEKAQRRPSQGSNTTRAKLEVVHVTDDDIEDAEDEIKEVDAPPSPISESTPAPIPDPDSDSDDDEFVPSTKKQTPQKRTSYRTSAWRKASPEHSTGTSPEPPRKRQRNRKADAASAKKENASATVEEPVKLPETTLKRWRKHYGWVRGQMGYLAPGTAHILCFQDSRLSNSFN